MFVDFNFVVKIYLIVINISVFCCNNCFENVDSLILMWNVILKSNDIYFYEY